MTLNELRIGNMIEYCGKMMIVERIDIEWLMIYNPEKTKPIPLTEEWLQKFGFELRDSVNGGYLKTTNRLLKEYIYCSKKGIVALYSELTEETKKDYIIGEIQSVHQLQNLYFALTGNELQIK